MQGDFFSFFLLILLKIFHWIPDCTFDASGVVEEMGDDRRLCNVGVRCMYLSTF